MDFRFGFQVWILGLDFRFRFEVQISGFRFQVTDFKFQISGFRFQISGLGNRGELAGGTDGSDHKSQRLKSSVRTF